MFEGLNAIPWADLTHAYGSAEEVPVWLRRLTSGDAKVRKEAMNDLWGSICHQNWICPATGYAVPYLIELLREPSVQDKDEILGLLADIASCEPLYEPRWRHNPKVRTWEVPAHIPFKDAHAEAAAGIPVYVSLLKHEQLQVRMQASHVLTAFPEQTAELRPILDTAYARETDEQVRANLVLALGSMSQPAPGDPGFFQDIVDSDTSELMRFVAALVLAGLAKENTPQGAADILASVMEQGLAYMSVYSLYEDLPCGSGYVAWKDALHMLFDLGPARLGYLLPRLEARVARATNNLDAHWYAELLLFIVFEGRPQAGQLPHASDTLTGAQRQALGCLLARADLWHLGNFTEVMRAYGLPSKRDEMANYLGNEASRGGKSDPQQIEDEDESGQVGDYDDDAGPFDQYLKPIREVYPSLAIRMIEGRWKEGRDEGQTNEVITVNNAILFRFPRYAQAVEEMEQEIAMLRGLQGRLPLPIPNPTFSSQGTSEVGRAFMGYEKLPGKPLHREMLESVDGEETVQRLATQLAEFLRALHGVPADAFAIPLPVANSRATWALMYERIREQLFSHMRPDAREQVSAHFERFLDDPRNFAWTPVLIHGDFGPGNILYDAKRRTISGIIDFSSAGLDDPATDLAALITPHSYGEDFLPRLEVGYPGISDLHDRARFYVGTFALQEALFGAEHDDAEAFARGMADYT